MNAFNSAIKSTLLRLRDCPLSYRDLVGQVAEFQRLCLDLHAMLDYVEIYEPRLAISLTEDGTTPLVDPKMMGCFTSDLEVACKLYRMGLPFWLIRSEGAIDSSKTKIKRLVSLLPPSQDIVTAEWYDHRTGTELPFPTLHHGYSGRDRHFASRRLGSAFADVIDLENRQIQPLLGKAPISPTSSGQTRGSPCKFFVFPPQLCCLN